MTRIALPLFLLLAAGCATAGVPQPAIERTTTDVSSVSSGANTNIARYTDVSAEVSTLAAPADQVFALLAEVYTGLGIEVGHSDPGTRTVGNRQVVATRRLGTAALSQYLRCGDTPVGTPSADSYRIRMSVLSTVEPAGSGSRVRTQVRATATPPGRNDQLECATTGRLELSVANALNRRLATQ